MEEYYEVEISDVPGDLLDGENFEYLDSGNEQDSGNEEEDGIN